MANTPPATIEDVFLRYGIPHRVDQGRGRWVSTHCPYCAGSADYHLGYSVEKSYFSCWRCGYHPVVDTLVVLLRVDRGTALDIGRSIRSGPFSDAARGARDKAAQARVNPTLYRHPSDVGPMRSHHRRYLENRGFDPDDVEREWGALGTGPVSYLDEISYRHRILVPVRWDGVEVSFQARDVTGKSDRKYLACPIGRERRHHKYILYGNQESWEEVGIVVEGVTDVWRLGPVSCAVFGIQYRPEQIMEIWRRFRRAVIVFDAEPAAQAQAQLLAERLRVLGTEPVVVDLGNGTDPGSMSQDDAAHLVRDLLGRS